MGKTKKIWVSVVGHTCIDEDAFGNDDVITRSGTTGGRGGRMGRQLQGSASTIGGGVGGAHSTLDLRSVASAQNTARKWTQIQRGGAER